MVEKYNGIVLSGINYGDNDKILNIFTLEKGVVTANLKGVKKAGAKLKFAAEPFCFAEYIFTEKSGRRTVINASLSDSFYPVREDIKKYYCAAAVVEYVKKFLKEEMVSPELFALVLKALKDIAYTGGDPAVALVAFLTDALALSGYALTLSGCYSCGKEPTGKVFFDTYSGSFLCEDCFGGKGREIKHSTFEALKNASLGLPVSPDGAKDALRLLDYYISNKADENISSLKELDNLL